MAELEGCPKVTNLDTIFLFPSLKNILVKPCVPVARRDLPESQGNAVLELVPDPAIEVEAQKSFDGSQKFEHGQEIEFFALGCEEPVDLPVCLAGELDFVAPTGGHAPSG